MKRKKVICIAVSAALILALPGCGAGRVSTALDIVSGAVDDMCELEPTPEPAVLPAATPQPTPEHTTEPTPEPTPTPQPMPTPRSDIYLTGAAQADYLRYAPVCTTPDDELRDKFTAAAVGNKIKT